MEASVRSFNRDDVLRMLDALKFALSENDARGGVRDGAVGATNDSRQRDGAIRESAITRFEGSSW